MCPQCDAALTVPVVCDSCHALIEPAPNADHFAMLGLPERFDVDEAALRSRYRKLARRVHPDRFAGQGDEVAARANRIAAALHTAVEVLSDPVRRAGYILERAGGPTPAEERGVPGNLLAEIMMIREAFEAAQAKSDEAALDEQREAIRARRDEAIERIAATANGLGAADDETKRSMRQEINSLKYFDNLLRDFSGDPFAQAASSSP